MKLNFDLNKSLEELEGNFWGDPAPGSTRLVQNCHAFRKIHLSALSIEEMRILIGQNIGLEFLIPMAIQELQGNVLAAGDFYEGDLLLAVLNSDRGFWKGNVEFWANVCGIVEGKMEILTAFETTEDIRDSLMGGIRVFRIIHD